MATKVATVICRCKSMAHLMRARLRSSNRDASADNIEELARIVGRKRRHWPKTRIYIRWALDSAAS